MQFGTQNCRGRDWFCTGRANTIDRGNSNL